jgi:hypothetical protein
MSNVEHFLQTSPSNCLPPNCGGDNYNDPTDPARMRINSMTIYSNSDNPVSDKYNNSVSVNHYLDDLYTTNSLGMPSKNNGRNANQDNTLYQQDFTKYYNKVYVNCPPTDISTANYLCGSSSCIPDGTNGGNIIGTDTTSSTGCTAYITDTGNANTEDPMWLNGHGVPNKKQFNNVAKCTEWCANNAECGGVQSYYYADPANGELDNKLHCNYYNNTLALEPTDISSTGKLQHHAHYNTFVKNKHPYLATATSIKNSADVREVIVDNDGTTTFGTVNTYQGLADALPTDLSDTSQLETTYSALMDSSDRALQSATTGNNEIYDAISIYENFDNKCENCLMISVLLIIFCVFIFNKK